MRTWSVFVRQHGLAIWAWCLMTMDVHLLVVPERGDSMGLALGNAHGKYAQWVNLHRGLSGHLWANRYYSTALDGEHLWAAVRYVELNPVRAAMVSRAEEYEWSSAVVHCGCAEDRGSGYGGLMAGERPFPGEVGKEGWSGWLARGVDEATLERLRRNTATGRPCGGEDFVTRLERELDRILRPQKVGRRPKAGTDLDPTADLFENL